jgi:hypothetical protein
MTQELIPVVKQLRVHPSQLGSLRRCWRIEFPLLARHRRDVMATEWHFKAQYNQTGIEIVRPDFPADHADLDLAVPPQAFFEIVS